MCQRHRVLFLILTVHPLLSEHLRRLAGLTLALTLTHTLRFQLVPGAIL